MDKLAACVLLSTLAGSLIYGMWCLFVRYFREECYLRAAYMSLHVVTAVFTVLVLFGLVLSGYISSLPGDSWWTMETPVTWVIQQCLAWVWLFGAIYRLYVYLIGHYRRYRLLKQMMSGDLHMNKILEEVVSSMGIKRRVKLVQSYAILTAELSGFFTPYVCVPADEYTDDELRMIITHELVHYRNRDRWIRETAIALECIHWFNPVIKRMHRQLERWDELYCDYCVCGYGHIDHMEYARVLFHMGEKLLARKAAIDNEEIMTTGFCERMGILQERIGKIMMYDKKNKQKMLAGVIAMILFVTVGAGTALGATATVKTVHDQAVKASVEGVPEEYLTMYGMEDSGLEEYEMEPRTDLIQQVSIGGAEVMADPTAFISATVEADGIWNSGRFHASSGQNIYVSVSIAPSDVNVKVGIMEPRGLWRYVYSSGEIVHSFELNKTGDYVVFVWNETETDVTAFGYYKTRDAK